MPCPLFEPRTRVLGAQAQRHRLPLLHEFEGICHAGEENVTAENRFHYCNQGNAGGHCRSFPGDMAISAVRFTVTCATPEALSVLMVEEANYWPRAWSKIEFTLEDQRVEPEIADVCRRAQLLQFCVSYLENTNG